MGTRGSIGFKLKGQYILTYNHWDSYPEGLGSEVIDFIEQRNKANDWDKLIKNVNGLKFVKATDDPTPEHIKSHKQYADDGVNGGNGYYSLLRDLQGLKGLEEVAKGKAKLWIIENDFVQDSLFCEYAYVIDLDDKMLLLFKGFQTEPQKDNPFGEEALDRGYESDDDYYPVKLIGKIPLKRIALNPMLLLYLKEQLEEYKVKYPDEVEEIEEKIKELEG